MGRIPTARILDELLEEDASSRLSLVAQSVLEKHFDVEHLRVNLIEKLQRLQYPQPPEKQIRKDKSFYQRLQSADALDVLEDSTLKEIHLCLLMAEIVARDRELEKKDESVKGHPLKFHHETVRELHQCIEAIEQLLDHKRIKNQFLQACLREIQEELARLNKEHMNLIISSLYPGPRAGLLARRTSTRLMAQEGVYQVLESKLRKKKGLTKRFLRQLAILICSPPDAKELEPDEPLKKALAYRKKREKKAP